MPLQRPTSLFLNGFPAYKLFRFGLVIYEHFFPTSKIDRVRANQRDQWSLSMMIKASSAE